MFKLGTVLATPAGTPPPVDGVVNLLGATAGEPDYVNHYARDAEIFDYFAEPADGATAHENHRLHQTILGEIPAAARVILDVGCGRAWVAEHLLAEREAVISFDLAPTNVRKALARFPAANHFGVIGDVLALPFRDASIDAIVSSEVMEHVGDVRTYLANLIRVVRPGGTIVLSTPYAERIEYSLCVHCNRATPHHAHLHSFNEPTVANLLRDFPGVTHRCYTISNKPLLYLRTHHLLRHLPYRLWRGVDGLANRLVRKPGRLVTVIRKTASPTP